MLFGMIFLIGIFASLSCLFVGLLLLLKFFLLGEAPDDDRFDFSRPCRPHRPDRC